MSQYSAPDTLAYRRARAATLKRDGYRCQLRLPGCTEVATQVDHIVPMSKNGDPLSLANCRASCAHCNQSRGAGDRERIGSPPHRTVATW
jgi:5-methylcytosine-specific restriction endonuclease McrA